MVCADCGVGVHRPMRGPSRRRCDACRCEHAKAWPSRAKVRSRCQCGKPKAVNAAHCLECYRAENRREIQICQHCQESFHPKRSLSEANFQRNKYCSRKCYFKWKQQYASERLSERDIKQFGITFRRELRARLQTARLSLAPVVRQCRGCGKLITDKVTAELCDVCFVSMISIGVRASHAAAKLEGHEHICPQCGRTFRGYARTVWCSFQCGHAMARATARGHYPSLTHLPLSVRNQLAGMIALMRQANQRISHVGR
jgi:hypothetical protein